ncbi:hypothetical protein VTI74DRAFT_9993 [Chaetomium olivicolor]
MAQSTLSPLLLALPSIPPLPTLQAALASHAAVALAVAAFTYLVFYLHTLPGRKPGSSSSAPPELPQPVGKIVRSFFQTQFDFFRDGFSTTSSSIFRFKLLRNEVTAIAGEEYRRTFFAEKGLNLYQGFQVLIGTIPSGLNPHELKGIYKRLGTLQGPDTLQSLIPQLLSDCGRKMDAWGKEGSLDPCSAIHDVTFQMIIRAVSSFDVADDASLVSRLKRHYDVIDSSYPTSAPILGLPSLAWFRRLWSSKCVYDVFKGAIDARIKCGTRREDALQGLLDAGEGTRCIAGFMMGLPIAGARSTGTIGTWLIMFLSSEPSWSSAVRDEIQTLLSTYASSPSSSLSKEALIDALSAIPLAAWESQTPHLDLCIRETLRRAQPHTAVRKNIGPAFNLGPYTIAEGDYVVYPFADTLLNPAYYPDPLRWDPSRSTHNEEIFLGWGGGKHMCKGQRLASLTMKLVAAYAFSRFDMAMIDELGQRMENPPEPDWNDFLTCRPKERCSIRFSERPCVSVA